MASYELVLRTPGAQPLRVRVPEKGLLVGRSEECDIALPQDPSISRKHAHIYPKGDSLVVEDLGSRNGVYLNDERHMLCRLNGGDVFRLGEQSFQVVRSDDTAVKHAVIPADHHTSIEKSLLVGTSDRSLAVLFQAARMLGEMLETETLSNAILQLIFDALPARRGYIFTLGGEPPEPVVRASMSRTSQDSGPPLSHTLIDHVFKTREAVLIHDAQDDSRFDQSASIIGYEIHSAMCAPLVGRMAPVGAIYVDSGTSVEPFERADLELLTAIARIVGVAVENAQLHEDRMKRERLAAIGEATAGLGHCIKNIMTGLRGSGDIIEAAMEKQDYGNLQMAWPIMSKCVDRIDALVMNMLSYSRLSDIETMRTDLNSLVREAIDTLRAQADGKGVAITFQSTPDAVIQADGREMLRVLVNLLSNAIDACDREGGAVELGVLRDESGLTVVVKDNGVGIPEHILPRVFEAFYSTKGSRGTGLGLACCEKIVAQHGGRIDVRSKSGEGAAFYVFLPFERKAGKATQSLTIIQRGGAD